MPITKVGTKWVNGALCFYNKATGVTVLSISPNGVQFTVYTSNSPSVSPSVSPSASPSS